MKSRTSCFNSTLLKKNFSRFAVIWGLYAGFLFLFCTVVLLNTRGTDCRIRSTEYLYESSVLFGNVMQQIYAIICAAACFGYLHSTRSAYMLHAMPMTRGTMFTTNLLSGWLFAILPQALITLLNLGAVDIAGSFVYGAVLETFAVWALEFTFYYGLAVFCMVMTGKTVFGVLSYYTLNIIVVLLELVIRVIVSPMLFGLDTITGMTTLPFSPAINLIVRSALMADETHCAISASLWHYLGVIAAVGIVFMAVSFLLYKKRHMENAGEVIAFRWAKPIFKYFFTVCVTLILGLLITVLAAEDSIDNGASAGMLICLLIAGFAGFFAAEMMLRRTPRVFTKKAFLEFAVYAAILLAVLLAVKFDVFGLTRKVPAPDTVSAIKVEMRSEYLGEFTFTDPEDIETVTQMHKTLLETHRKGTDNGEKVSVRITYTLKNGSTLVREYSGVPSGTSGTEFAALLDGKPELLESYYDAVELTKANDIYIQSCPDMYRGCLELTYPNLQFLEDCLQNDMEAGNILLYEDIVCIDWGEAFLLRIGDGSIVIPPSAENAYSFLSGYLTN